MLQIGRKMRKTLAKSVREWRLASYIPQLLSATRQKVALPKQIAHKFRDFYSSLHNLSDQSTLQAQVDDNVTSSQLPQLPREV